MPEVRLEVSSEESSDVSSEGSSDGSLEGSSDGRLDALLKEVGLDPEEDREIFM